MAAVLLKYVIVFYC